MIHQVKIKLKIRDMATITLHLALLMNALWHEVTPKIHPLVRMIVIAIAKIKSPLLKELMQAIIFFEEVFTKQKISINNNSKIKIS